MNYYTNARLKFIDFWKRNKKIILICLIVFLVVIVINYILKKLPKEAEDPSYSYAPQIAVVNNQEVPESVQKPIENIVDTYFNYCNNKDYESAYNMLSTECKNSLFPSIEVFKKYINNIFGDKKKVYTLQSYSVVDNVYIYDMKITNDYMADGTSEGYYSYNEKIVLTDENGEFKLGVKKFISQGDPHVKAEDDYMKVEVLDVVKEYDRITYKLKITNKMDDKYIVIADGTQANEIKLDLDVRKDSPDNTVTGFVVNPGAFRYQELYFSEFYDNELEIKGIFFGAVRILDKYDYSVGTTQENIDTAYKLYSALVPVK